MHNAFWIPILVMAITTHFLFFVLACTTIWKSRETRTDISDEGREAWRELAQRWNLDLEGRKLFGALRGVPARLELGPSQFGGAGFSTHVALALDDLVDGAVHTNGAVVALDRSWRVARTGDETFDKVFVARCEAQLDLLPLLSAGVRRELLAIEALAHAIRLDARGIKVELAGVVEESRTLDEVLSAMDRLVEELAAARTELFI